MKDHIVSIDLITASTVTPTQISELLGIQSSLLKSRSTVQGILWKLESGLENTATLEDHIKKVISKVPSSKQIRSNDIIEEIYFVIGVFYSSATCTVSFPPDCINLILSKFPEAIVEITCYPCEEDN